MNHLISYILHFCGGAVAYFIWHNMNDVAMIAVTWEVAQFEGWWNLYGYKFDILYKYNWLDSLFDIGLAFLGAVLCDILIAARLQL